MLALLAGLVLAQNPALPPLDAPPRLRTTFPNGTTVLVERIASAQTVSAQLFVSSQGEEDRPDTHGMRHLLEHFLAEGRKGDLDQRLESAGGFLAAVTSRDAMAFEVVLPASRLNLALDALVEVASPLPTLSPARMAREIEILRQELALAEYARRLGGAAWTLAYGDAGLDPLGSLEVMAQASSDTLETLRQRLFTPGNRVVVVAGPVDVQVVTRLLAERFGSGPEGFARPPWAVRPEPKVGRTAADAFGEARAVAVGPYREPETMATLAAALALATREEGAFVTYTPTLRPGLVILGNPTRRTGLLGRLRDPAAEPTAAFGRLLARAWLDRQLRTPSGITSLRGLLLVQSVNARPEQMSEAIAAFTPAQFAEALTRFRADEAISVGGNR